jgi:hypothetical protein
MSSRDLDVTGCGKCRMRTPRPGMASGAIYRLAGRFVLVGASGMTRQMDDASKAADRCRPDASRTGHRIAGDVSKVAPCDW